MNRKHFGMEYDWVAADAFGRVALFATAGFGPLPEWALDQDQTVHDQLLRLPVIALRIDDGPVVGETWLSLVERGVPSFDWNGNYYVRVTTPSAFVKVQDMPGELRAFFATARLGSPTDWEEMSIVNSVHLGLGPFRGA